MRTALAIRHVAFEDLGSFASVLHGRGYQVRYVEAGCDDLARIDPLGPELLILLGGPIGVYEDEAYPFIRDELRLAERRMAADRPTLGLCLGSQMMARALGARVYPGSGKEIGWSPLSLTDAGRESCASHLAPELTEVLHWHGDTFDLPDGAVRLASTQAYANQAFSFGKAALAFQFHPEVTAAGLERWYIGHACEISSTPGISVARLRADAAREAQRLEKQGRHCLTHWLSQLEAA
jgi:GMP synthase (glutamine-hydrolysing)